MNAFGGDVCIPWTTSENGLALSVVWTGSEPTVNPVLPMGWFVGGHSLQIPSAWILYWVTCILSSLRLLSVSSPTCFWNSLDHPHFIPSAVLYWYDCTKIICSWVCGPLGNAGSHVKSLLHWWLSRVYNPVSPSSTKISETWNIPFK